MPESFEFKNIDNSILDLKTNLLWKNAEICPKSVYKPISQNDNEQKSAQKYSSNCTEWRSVNYLRVERFNGHEIMQVCCSSSTNSSNMSVVSFPPNLDFNLCNKPECTLHMDMTQEDIHYYHFDDFSKLEDYRHYSCDVKHSGNKVCIFGQAVNVYILCQSFIANSTIQMKIELDLGKFLLDLDGKKLEIHFSQLIEYFRRSFNVSILYQRAQSKYEFIFQTFQKYGLELADLISMFKNLLQKRYGNLIQISKFISELRIPPNRRDITGRANMYIEQIQNKYGTEIKLHRSKSFDLVVISHDVAHSIIGARFELISRFIYELKFGVFLPNTQPLVEYITQMPLKLKEEISISIEPGDSFDYKILSIAGNAKNIFKLFKLRGQLLGQVQNYLT